MRTEKGVRLSCPHCEASNWRWATHIAQEKALDDTYNRASKDWYTLDCTCGKSFEARESYLYDIKYDTGS